MSTLPWQQNFAGLIGGIFFGMGLTFALVPFVNITKYNRKSKVSFAVHSEIIELKHFFKFQINLIWTCILLHLLLYAAMFVIFYVFPTLFSSLGFAGAHPNDHFTNGQPGHFDNEHNLNSNNNQNVFNGVINNYNTGGGIVSSIRSPPSQFHMNIGHKNY